MPCAADDPRALEKLRRDITRPALGIWRVQANAVGQVVLTLKTPWRNGAMHLVMSPLKFTHRLVAQAVIQRRLLLSLAQDGRASDWYPPSTTSREYRSRVGYSRHRSTAA